MATSFGTTVPFHPGVMVAVNDGTIPPWEGQITRTGLFPTSAVMVAVVEPPADRSLVRGQRVMVLPRHLRQVFQPSRWSR